MTEPVMVVGDNPLLAWQAGCRHLVEMAGHEAYNMVTHIANPIHFCPEWLAQYNPRQLLPKEQGVSDVANTIFPHKYAHLPREDVYARYKCANARGFKGRHKGRWGTYFHRMIAFGVKVGEEGGNNQLEAVIRAMETWQKNHKAALRICLSSPDTDSTVKIMANPCLQYVQFLCPDSQTTDMLAVYRNHDFFKKAFGNFIGLGSLLKFVCDHTGRESGTLTCHSAHAFIGSTEQAIIQLAGIKRNV